MKDTTCLCVSIVKAGSRALPPIVLRFTLYSKDIRYFGILVIAYSRLLIDDDSYRHSWTAGRRQHVRGDTSGHHQTKILK